MAIELSDELIELEKAAWPGQQENRLTVETAARVQAAIAGIGQRSRSRAATRSFSSSMSDSATSVRPDPPPRPTSPDRTTRARIESRSMGGWGEVFDPDH
ncbi:hypothetical protein [Streptomyces sp900116325]|uniref:hypothetical protein n=1 Tax=Streptomyces sp. 900116325 TaxID=3154295 RepID=UPI0033B9F2F0